MIPSDTITVEVLHLLVVLLALAAISFLVGWVLGQRGERSTWVSAAEQGDYLACDGRAYAVTRLPIDDFDDGFNIPWPWPTRAPMEDRRITHRVVR